VTVSLYEQLTTTYGADFFERRAERRPTHVWHQVCVCGHLDRYHGPAIGGGYRLPEPKTQSIRGEQVTVVTVLGGCVGALKPKGFEETSTTADRDDRRILHRLNPTCPCTEFRPVARVDRPNRYFNQRIPADRTDPARHPFAVGLRALATHLSKRRAAQADPDWAAAELDRRFRWLDADDPDERPVRACARPRCRATGAEVWPVFVDGTDRSELRCPKHR